MALIRANTSGGGGNEKIYIATASSNAEVKAWDVVTSFSNPNVYMTLPFEPKYIMTYCKYSNGNTYWWNIWDKELSTTKYIQVGVPQAYASISQSSIATMPTSTNSWLANVSGKNITLLNNDSLTLTDGLFIAIG